MSREQLEFDIIIVGAGPAGLSAAIKLKQLNTNCSICILEKGAQVGAHILSGAVLETAALEELIPDWESASTFSPFIQTPVKKEHFWLLTKSHRKSLPIPKAMRNHPNNRVISLGTLCQSLAKQAESLGVEIFPGFAASDLLFRDNQVIGVATGDMGIDREGNRTDRYQPGVNIFGNYVLLAEGSHGSLSKKVIQRYNLRSHSQAQTYGLGIKELWEIPEQQHHEGTVIHTLGWPLDSNTYGGAFIYHLPKNKLAVGMVVGLDYQNPTLDPFQELQRVKTHPAIKPLFSKAKRIGYGARALNEGGWQSLPKMSFPGGLLLGCSAGLLNVAKIKGIHNAIRSGIIAAETIHATKNEPITKPSNQNDLTQFNAHIRSSIIGKELKRTRNIRPGFKLGLIPGMINAAIDNYLFHGHAPWTFKHHIDHETLTAYNETKPITYPKPDGVITFDKLSSVYLSNTNHRENQPCHLVLNHPAFAIEINYRQYHSPETYYCPANVYEILIDEKGNHKLQINAQNCVHCKACDIKDPCQNINWIPPEGSDGPNYIEM